MNFKKQPSLVTTICIIIFCTMSFAAVLIRNSLKVNITTYEIPPNICQALFDCTPEEFTENRMRLHFTNGDRCYSYKVDKDGDLLLSLSEEQINNWKEQCEEDFESVIPYRTKVSPEYDRVVFECKDKSLEGTSADQAVVACAIFQMLDGCKPEEITVEYVVIDYISKEELQRVVWPAEDWSLSAFGGYY